MLRKSSEQNQTCNSAVYLASNLFFSNSKEASGQCEGEEEILINDLFG
jgi:hypothetical protein